MTCRLFVALLPSLGQSLCSSSPNNGTVAIVIDTLRFTTTACHALSMGAEVIAVAATIDEARQIASQRVPCPLLCGERHCHPIEGFDLGNSPFEYTAERVKQRELVFTTTNGTLAVTAAIEAAHILLGSFFNRRAVCRQLEALTRQDVVILCAGTDGQVALEDVLTAGAITEELLCNMGINRNAFALGNDSARLALAAWRELATPATSHEDLQHQIDSRIRLTMGGQNLLDAGYERDVRFASRLDASSAVPMSTYAAPNLFRLATEF